MPEKYGFEGENETFDNAELEQIFESSPCANGMIGASLASFLVFSLKPSTLQKLSTHCVMDIQNITKDVLGFSKDDHPPFSVQVHMSEQEVF